MAVNGQARLAARGGIGARTRMAALAAEIAALHQARQMAAGERPVIFEAQLTSTGTAVFFVSEVEGARPIVVKMPMQANAAARLDQETAVLRAIHADRRLGSWRGLVPQPMATGSLRGQRYRIESALDGSSALRYIRDPQRGQALVDAALDAIGTLHRTTATAVEIDRDLATRWVDAQVRELDSRASLRASLRPTLERLCKELRQGLIGKVVSAGRIHGDFWAGNLLCRNSGGGPDAVTGVVDWDASGGLELPLHDLLHLLLSTRCLLTRRELGEVVREQLLTGRWTAAELAGLERHGAGPFDKTLAERQILLLYWLRQAAMHARQQNLRGGWRYRVWERRNIVPVLSAL